MKKSIITLAAAIAMAIGANAEVHNASYSFNFDSTDYYEGNFNAPADWGYNYSGSQTIYTPDEIKEITDRNGEITAIHYHFYNIGIYEFSAGYDADVDIKVYFTEIDTDKFTKGADGKWHFVDYDTEYVATYNGNWDVFGDQTGYMDWTTELKLNKPFKPTPGKSLLLTAVCEISDPTPNSSVDIAGYYTRSAGNGTTILTYHSYSTDAATGMVSSAQANYSDRDIPVVKFDYTWDDTPAVVACETPVITPANGSTVLTTDLVTITCATDGASIYYSLINTEPTTLYTGPFALGEHSSVTAVAKKDGFDDSATARAEYSLQSVAPPVITPASGRSLGPDDEVTITCTTAGAEIYYSLNTDPTVRPYEEAFTIDKACTVTAYATKAGFLKSGSASASYTLKTTKAPAFVTAPYAELGKGETVKIKAETGDIFYTFTKGETPATPYDPATGIPVTEDCTIYAIAVAAGSFPSSAVSASYTYNDVNYLKVGNFDATEDDYNNNLFSGSNNYNSPIIFTYDNSGTQTIYRSDEVATLKNKVIKSIAFRYFNGGCFDTYASTAKLYIQEVDTDNFVYDAGSEYYKWFSFGPEPTVVKEIEIEFSENYYMNDLIVFNLDKPFECTGKSLLITVVNESPQCIDNSSNVCFFKYNPGGLYTAVFASDRRTFADCLAEDDLIKYSDERTSKNESACVRFEYADNPSGIETIGADINVHATNETVYYNLQGIRVDNPAPGQILIKHEAGRATKVLVK